MTKRKITKEEDIQKIIKMYADGMSIRSISLVIGVGRDAISDILHENRVEIRKNTPPIRKSDVESAREKLYKLFEEGLKYPDDYPKLAEKVTCSKYHVKRVYDAWKIKKDGEQSETKRANGRPENYTTLRDLNALRDQIRIGDVITIVEPASSAFDSYIYSQIHGPKINVTILGKCKHFAITDHHDRLWQDIYYAIKRLPENINLKRRINVWWGM